MIRPGSLLALFALLATSALAEDFPPGEIPGDLMTAVTHARYAVRFETEQKIPAISNYAQDLRARFEDRGIEVTLRRRENAAWPALEIRLSRWGREGTTKSPGPGARRAWEHRVEYRYEGITEWWLNTPRGLEQGFTIAAAPPGNRTRPLIINMEVSGGWRSELAGNAIDLFGPHGEHLRYSGLAVNDATGAAVEARLSVSQRAIGITVDDGEALYPITIDPLLTNQEAKLLATSVGGEPDSLFGFSVALDGDSAVIGAPDDDSARGVNTGSARVFVRNGTSWTHQAELHANDGSSGHSFGRSVALSGDTALIGAPGGNTVGGLPTGAAYVFVRSGTSWSQQSRLLAPDPAPGDQFGSSVALSGDTALVGAPFDDKFPPPGNQLEDAGSAHWFLRTGTAWSQVDIQFGAAIRDSFGNSVALSGNTALVGAHTEDTPGVNAGAVYVYFKSGATWLQQQRLLADDAVPGDRFGNSVALSGDTALVGANLAEEDNKGSAYVFVRAGSVWAQQAELLSSDGVAGDQLGTSVALSGNSALLGTFSGAATAGSAYVFVRSGTIWTQQAKLLAGDGAAGDEFGTAVALSADTALVGARLDDTVGGSNTGSAYVFIRGGTNWSEQTQLLARGRGNYFGVSVALNGETGLVGAPGDDIAGGPNGGSAYVFVRTGGGWTQQAQLLAGDGASNDNFGISVALSGETALVGASTNDTPELDAGSAYVFVRSGTSWSQQAQLLAFNRVASDNFGNSVALSGNTALVGAFNEDNAGNGTQNPLENTQSSVGSAYVFVRSGTNWTHQAWLTASDGAADDHFGNSLALNGETALVGASLDNNIGGVAAGSAYIFTRSGATWSQQARILAADGTAGDFFGSAVALSADGALVGADGDGDVFELLNAGAAYVFVRSGTNWTQQARLLASDAVPNHHFGRSVALSGDTALVGATEEGSSTGGAAYVFVRSGAIWTEQAQLLADDGASDDRFGISVALSGDTVLVGAYLDNTTDGIDAGSAYVFRLGEPPPDTQPTSTSLTSSANPSPTGQAVTFTATVTSTAGIPAGDVIFRNGTVIIGTHALNAAGSAQHVVANLSAGNHSITAHYQGSAVFLPSSSLPLTQSVQGIGSVRTWVATFGADTNNCSRTSPCRTFAAAAAVVNPGGEIVVLDSGGYGAVTLTKPVTLLSPPGAHAAIAPTSGDAIVVNVAATGVVIVRGLYLNSQGAARGIVFSNGAALQIENCVISGFTEGVDFTGPGDLAVLDSALRSNGDGVKIRSGAIVLIDQSRIEGNSQGVVTTSSRVEVRKSVISRNTTGVSAFGGQHHLDQCAIVGNSIGIFADDLSSVVVSDSLVALNFTGMVASGMDARVFAGGTTITANQVGISVDPSSDGVFSHGNNRLAGNTTDGTFTAIIPLE